MAFSNKNQAEQAANEIRKSGKDAEVIRSCDASKYGVFSQDDDSYLIVSGNHIAFNQRDAEDIADS